jgi:chromosome partitioning protein
MNIVVWADKGGAEKTTLATSIAAELRLPLLDLDPQEDAYRWMKRRSGLAVSVGDRETLQDLLMRNGSRVADCPPGQSPMALTAVALADILIIPVRTGDADMVALGRALDVVRRVRSARPGLRVGVFLSLARDTGRAKGVEAALRSQAGSEFTWLGRLSARVGVEDAYASGRTLLEAGGAVANEFRQILQVVCELFDSFESDDSTES